MDAIPSKELIIKNIYWTSTVYQILFKIRLPQFLLSKNEKKIIFIGFNKEHELAIPLNSVTLDNIFFFKARTVFLLLDYTQPLT